MNLKKCPRLGSFRIEKRGIFSISSHKSQILSNVLQIYMRQPLQGSLLFSLSFSSTVLVWFFHDISVIKAKWHIPRLAPQLVAFNFIQSKCPVELLAVTATKAICHNRDKKPLWPEKILCCFKALRLIQEKKRKKAVQHFENSGSFRYCFSTRRSHFSHAFLRRVTKWGVC